MTPDQFAALADLLRLRDGGAREAARLVLVEGLSITQAGERAGVSRQSAGNTVARCRAGLELVRRVVGG